MKKWYLFVLILLINNALAKRIKRAVGGEPAKKGQFPFFARLILPDDVFKADICSGSLINPKWILTAADCFPSDPEAIERIERFSTHVIYTVYMGMLEINDTSAYPNAIKKVYIHPGFYKEKLDVGLHLTHNIALIELKRKYKLHKHLNTIYLPPLRKPIKRCDVGRIISIAPTSWHDQTSQNSINVVQIRVRDTFEEVKIPSPTLFYSQAVLETRHALEGDVGAPFVCSLEPDDEDEVIQYGVVAGVMNTTKGTMITFIEDVEKYMGFIQKHVPAVKLYSEMSLGKRRILPLFQAKRNKRNKAAPGNDTLIYEYLFVLLFWFVVL